MLAVMKQTGYHYTMFSPNADGEKIFQYLGFKRLDTRISILPNVPTISLGRRCHVT